MFVWELLKITMEKNLQKELVTFALEMAKASEKQTLAYFRQPVAIDNKVDEGFDPVTEGDKGAERIMRAMIEEKYPNHGVNGEEYGPKQGSSPYTWVLDPIDGTRSFIAGMTSWTTLIGLEYEDEPVVGVMHQPYVGETFVGTPEGAYMLRGGELRELKVNPAPNLSQAFGTTTGPDTTFDTPQKRKFLNDLRSNLRNIRYDGDAYFFSLLAAGHVDIAIDAGLQAYDVCALVPIIRGAGGIVTTWDGGPAHKGGDILAAASQELYDQARALME